MKKLTLILMGIAACGVSCSSKDKKFETQSATPGEVAHSGPTMAAKQIAVEEEASYVTEIGFAKGSSKLTEASKKNLRDLLESAGRVKKVDEIKVITWGDSEYPSVRTGKLANKDIGLVKQRNEAIEKYVEAYNKDFDVELFSMAERPNALQSLFGTSDARIKKSLETAGIPNTDSSVKAPAKASKSIVMVIVE